MTYGKRTLIAVDQLLNTLLGGWPDETLSSRCYRWARDGVRAWPRKLVDGLFFWQREHCKSSYESEREGRQSPPELRRVRRSDSTRGFTNGVGSPFVRSNPFRAWHAALYYAFEAS